MPLDAYSRAMYHILQYKCQTLFNFQSRLIGMIKNKVNGLLESGQSVSQSVWCCLTLSHSSDNDIQYEVSN